MYLFYSLCNESMLLYTLPHLNHLKDSKIQIKKNELLSDYSYEKDLKDIKYKIACGKNINKSSLSVIKNCKSMYFL